jgi:hypothetical protein
MQSDYAEKKQSCDKHKKLICKNIEKIRNILSHFNKIIERTKMAKI